MTYLKPINALANEKCLCDMRHTYSVLTIASQTKSGRMILLWKVVEISASVLSERARVFHESFTNYRAGLNDELIF